MNVSNLEWAKAKAEQMLRNQVEQIAKSQFPASDFAEGMVEMAYGCGLITDAGYAYWRRQIDFTVRDRRDELREAKCRALFDLPGMINGELISGGMHENG